MPSALLFGLTQERTPAKSRVGFQLNVLELYYIKLIYERIQDPNADHFRTLFFLLKDDKHYTFDEIKSEVKSKNLPKVLQDLEKTGLIENEGWLYIGKKIEEFNIID